MVEYQKIDTKLFQLEKALAGSQNKKQCEILLNKSKESQNKSASLEKQAETIAREIDQLKKIADLNRAKIYELSKNSAEKMSAEQIEKAMELKEKLSQNLALLDKKVTRLAENVSFILTEFNKAGQFFNACKQKYQQHKKDFDQEVENAQPQINAIKKELSNLEKNVDKELIELYKKKRNDKIFPILVALNNKSCGGCHMEIPASQISKIEEKGTLICENCRRIIYKI